MRLMFLVLLLGATGWPASGQILARPTDPPLVTAVNESWYQLREPVQFAGDLYYPAGATIFFDGNTMVRTGHYNGVPLYVETTVEPFSIILVPIGRGLMQPYERPRRGDVAGTTGSRPPSFPVRLFPESTPLPVAATAPTNAPVVSGAIGVFTPNDGRQPPPAAAPVPAEVGTAGVIMRPAAPTLGSLGSIRRPESNDGIWVTFADERWVASGRAVRLDPQQFRIVGEYAGGPVFARREFQEDVIYLPTATELIAPYRLKE